MNKFAGSLVTYWNAVLVTCCKQIIHEVLDELEKV